MFLDPRLFLNLSTGPVPSPQIRAVNLDTYSIAGRYNAVAVWLKGAAEPRYFPFDSRDAGVIASWADTQYGEQFLRLSTMLFNVCLIETAMPNDAGEFSIRLRGDELPFVLPGNAAVRQALLLWLGEFTEASLLATAN